MEGDIKIFRKRYEPDEIIELKDDEVLHRDGEYILTKWNCLKPRTDISHGISAYILNENIKVSKVFRGDHSLVYWYCDIIRTEYDPMSSSYVFIDLLIDVLIREDGTVSVVDLGEMGELLLEGRLSTEEAALSLKTTDKLLKMIGDGSFTKYQNIINAADC